ncbi:tetratricopeptide repeat protein [Martelella alba]|uniref:Tetratricopeptide repeat protein n=1 Tax=Martelella alba TaxID=2590451 RepID=A0A506UEH1_9HYPH|nr:tetratricopeptide repeat protein [Martelella alba]TPW32390.1 tetratricopeptide repeat protein [Martelella alba]
MDSKRRFNTGSRRFLTTAALALALGFPAIASADTAPVTSAEAMSMTANSFAGALLAGQMAANDNDLESAIAFFRRALQFSPDDPGTNSQLFVALMFRGDVEGATAQSGNVGGNIQLAPLVSLARGLDSFKRGDYDDALKQLGTYKDSDIDRLAANLVSAWAMVGKGDVDGALDSLDGIKGPEWFKVFVNYTAGAIADQAGMTAKARTYFNNALFDEAGVRAAPDTLLKIVTALAAIEQAAGNTQKALDVVSVAEGYGLNDAVLTPLRDQINNGVPIEGKAASIEAGGASAFFMLGAALNQGGSDDLVSLYVALAAALDASDPGILFLQGQLAVNAKDPELALSYFSRIPATAPQYRLAELQSGLALADTGKSDEAKAKLEDLIAASPDDRRGYLALSAIYSSDKEYEDMARVLDKAVEVIGPVPATDDWGIFYRRGIAYERLHQWDKAEPNFFKALDLYPEQPEVLNYLGYSWIDQGINLDKGLDMIKTAVDKRPDDGYIVDSLGWAYFRLGRFDDAANELEHAVELDSSDPTINYHLGDAYWRTGRKLEAMYQWSKALTLGPEPDDIPEIKDRLAHGLPDLPATEDSEKAASAESTAPPASDSADPAPAQ